MAQIPKSPRKQPSCIPIFFRCSGKNYSRKSSDDPQSVDRKKSRWFPWSRFRAKKSAAKTVPLDAAVQEKATRSGEIHPETPEKLSSDAVHGAPVASEKAAKIQTRFGTAQTIILENRKDLDRLDSSKAATCLNKKRKIECKRSRSSHLSLPVTMSPTASRPASVARSVSFPPPRPQTPTPSRVEKSPADGKFAGNSDSFIAMTIITVTLAMIVICGRLFAIFFTSAWFCFVYYLRSDPKSNGILNSVYDDDGASESEALKKKVIFEGFLNRSNRPRLGIL